MRKPSRPFFSGEQPSLLTYCLERDTLYFSLKMALMVGTLLALINHGYALLTGHVTSGDLWSILLTYCVPFAVAMYSQVQGKRQRDHARVTSELQSGGETQTRQEKRAVTGE